MVQCPAGKLAGFFMRFTIRDVLWATVVVALAVGWWADHGMLKGLVRWQSQKYAEHVSREHPGQAEYERLLSEWIGHQESH
jgi:hypothetical protein